MEAMGALNPVDVVEGKIQAKVARFLSMKAVLNKARSSPMINIREEAEQLYVAQQQLEADLAGTLEKIKVMKAGPWDMGGIVSIGSFGMALMKHIRSVEDLDKRGRQSGAIKDDSVFSGGSASDFITSPIGMGIIGIGALMLLKKF